MTSRILQLVNQKTNVDPKRGHLSFTSDWRPMQIFDCKITLCYVKLLFVLPY